MVVIRPCFLVIDKPFAGNISTRKLVIETAMLNVITAYSAEEAVETLAQFPRVDGVVLDVATANVSCQDLIGQLRAIRPDIPIITVSPNGYDRCDGEQYHVSSYSPRDLLEQLQKICSARIEDVADSPASGYESSDTN